MVFGLNVVMTIMHCEELPLIFEKSRQLCYKVKNIISTRKSELHHGPYVCYACVHIYEKIRYNLNLLLDSKNKNLLLYSKTYRNF